MPIIRKEEAAPERPIIILIYGEPGSGKTSLANTANEVVMLDLDRGYDRSCVRVDTIVASKWEDILNDENELKNYKTVSIDTVRASLDDFLVDYVCNKDYKLKANKQRMYGVLGEEFKAFVNRRRSEGADLIFVAHDKEDAGKDIIRHSPDITGQSKNLLLRIADQVGYIHMQNGKRVISFDPTEEYTGKNVAEIPPTEIPDKNDPAYQTFMAGIIRQIKEKIQTISEGQRITLAKIAEAKDSIELITEPSQADDILKNLNEMPTVQQKPLKVLLLGKCKTLNIAFDKESGKFKLEGLNQEESNQEKHTQE